MFDQIKKDIALKAYVKKLGPLLVKRYGKSDTYTLGQILTTVGVAGLNKNYLFYGYAMFCSKESFDEKAKEINKNVDIESLRLELDEKFFEGNADLSSNDLFAAGGETVYGLTDGGSSGGFSGGDSGGSGGDAGGGGGDGS
jgi:hypothetical protein